MVITALNDKLGRNNSPSTENGFSTWRQMYYDIENNIMVNQSVNEFYTRLFFKIDAITQDVALLLDVAETV